MAIYTIDQILKNTGSSIKDVKVLGAPNVEEKKGGYSLGETIEDVKQTGSKILGTIKDTYKKTQEAKQASRTGEQGMLRGFAQQAGIGLGGISNVVGDVVTGAVKTALPQAGEEAVKGAVASVVKPATESDFVKGIYEKYNSLDEAKKRDIDSVLGLGSFLADVTGAGIVGKGAKTTLKAGEEAITTGLKVGEDLIESGAKTLSTVGDGAIKPENIMQRVARVNPTEQSKFKQVSGETVGEYLVNRKIFGNSEKIASDLVKRFQDSKKSADDAIATLKGEYKPTPIKTALNELFTKEKSISSPGALSKDFKEVLTLKNKFDKQGLDMTEINRVKRLLESNYKMDFLKQNLPEGVKKANTLDDAIRKWQFDQAEKLGLKNLPEINDETRYAKMLADALGKKLAGSSANNAVSLTDWVALSGGDPASVAMFLGKKALSSSRLQSKIAEKLSSGKIKKEVKAEFGKKKPDLTDFLNRD